MNIIECAQNDSVWHETRCGRITASRVKDVLSFNKDGNPSAARIKYMMELVCERLTGKSARHFVTPEMERGSELEPLARTAYELRSGNIVSPVSIAIHATMPYLAASPDGRLLPNGLTEFKCPTTAKHIEWMCDDKMPEEHAFQVYTCIDVWEADFSDFLSYDDRLPLGMQEFGFRLWRDDTVIKMMREGIAQFHEETEEIMERLRARFPMPEKIASLPPPEDPRGEEWLNVDEAFAQLDKEYAAETTTFEEEDDASFNSWYERSRD